MLGTQSSSATWRGRASADIVVGLGWGDEGKGATVDFLAAHSKARRIVRFNGGQQAAHNVIYRGKHHTFSSLGAGAFTGAETWISKYCTVAPLALDAEINAFFGTTGMIPSVRADVTCLVTTPMHIAANVVLNKENQHGTTGTGFFETIKVGRAVDALRVEDLFNTNRVREKLDNIAGYYDGIERVFDLDEMARQIRGASHSSILPVTHDQLLEEVQRGHTIFEGAQGFHLDENFGFFPHVTPSTTTPSNARAILREAGVDDVMTVGCLRTYATRHGNGPLPHEGELDFSPHEPHNGDDGVQGVFRTGKHDMEDIKAAIDITSVDCLSVSHLDIFDKMQTGEGPVDVGDLPLPVRIRAFGPNREDRV